MSKQLSQAVDAQERVMVYQWINDLKDIDKRELALLELSQRRDTFPNLATLLWQSFGTSAAFLQEIFSIYPAVTAGTLTAKQSNRICNALSLIQCVATNPETRRALIKEQFPMFLYPFLQLEHTSKPFEYLRFTSMAVIGALVKSNDDEVATFLLNTDFLRFCLSIMEKGLELSQVVATFIMEKILQNKSGLEYICETYERFESVNTVLGIIVIQLTSNPCASLLKHVIRCYLNLLDNSRARKAIRECILEPLQNDTFHLLLREEPIRELLKRLKEKFSNVSLSNCNTEASVKGWPYM